MDSLFKNYLFSKHILVQDSSVEQEHVFETLFALANLFNIKIVSGQKLAAPDMIQVASEQIGIDVPEAFYKGFPKTVRALSKNALLFDQLVHYVVTYGFGNFSEAGHSVLEEKFERIAFKEECEIKEFVIVTEAEAIGKMRELVDNLLKSTRPINDAQFDMIKRFIDEYDYDISFCENKDTAIRLVLETNDKKYAQFISVADILKVVERIQYERYGNENLKKLNLRNKDRKLISGLIDVKFTKGDYVLSPYSNAVKECYERQAIWAGLLHHIHYQPVNEAAKAFVDGIRSGKNISVLSGFEKAMMKKDIQGAVEVLVKGKGSGAVLRKLNYILSRCDTEEDVKMVMENIETENPIILIQMLMQYEVYREEEARFFRFTKFNKLRVHKETYEEMIKRQSVVPDEMRGCVKAALYDNLLKIYKGRLGKVYIGEEMSHMAVPLQENTSMGGYGILCRGSRVPIPVEEGKKIRVFTYWEKVNDIDLSVFGLEADGKQKEFSWRSMRANQSDGITFSGDQTRGYHGGSEYFDIDVAKFKKMYPKTKYLIFCNNVFSRIPFNQCICRAGYMIRDINDSGQIFEPKTVQSSYDISCDSTFAYMFGIDMDTCELVWLNMTRESMAAVAGKTSMKFLMDYFVLGKVFTVRDLFFMLATEVVADMAEADVIVTDETVEVNEGTEVIRSYDFEKIMAYMNM